MKVYRKFKRKYRVLHILLVAIAIVLFWRGTWELFDTYLLPDDELASSCLSILIAFFILYFDDFHLKELE